MGLDPHVRVFGCQFTGTAQLHIGATGGKTRRDGVAQAALAMPLLDERLGVDQTLLGVVTHTVGRVAVLQALAGDEAHAACLRLAEQGIDRFRVRGGKRERRRHSVAQQFRYKKNSCLSTVFGVCKAFFFWKCVVF